MSRLLALNKPEWPYGLVGFVAAAVSGCANPAVSFLLAAFITIFYIPDVEEMKRQVRRLGLLGAGSWGSGAAWQLRDCQGAAAGWSKCAPGWLFWRQEKQHFCLSGQQTFVHLRAAPHLVNALNPAPRRPASMA